MGFAASLLLAGLVNAGQPDERAFWDVWTIHSATTNDHKKVLAACGQFEKSAPGDPLIMVTRQLAAWRLLKLGRKDDAAALLTPMVSGATTGLKGAASEAARTWLTRLDRESLKQALQKEFVSEVAYPASLDALAGSGIPPALFKDRWGEQWEYRLVGFEHISGLLNQKYELRSATLGASSDLGAALAAPYGGEIGLRAVRLGPAGSGTPLVEFSAGANSDPAFLSVDATLGTITFAFMGDRIILLSDGSHWKAMSKPRR